MWHPTTFNTKNNTNILHTNIIYQPVEFYVIISAKKLIIWMQRARRGFINGKQDVKAAEKHSVECIVLLTSWFIILSCLGRCNKRPSHNIMLNRSIVHAISLHVSEVPFSGVVRVHTMCAAPECRQRSLCARNRRYPVDRCIYTSVYQFNIDELLLKLLAKRGSLTCFMCLPIQAARACQRLSVLALFTQNRTQRACTERSCLSRPNAF